jgi:hypothetical protein
MTLVTTGQRKGADAIAAAWAARHSVPLVAFALYGKGKAAFARNRKLVELKPVEAVLCEGSGIQANLYQLLRGAGVPIHAFRTADQAPDAGAPPAGGGRRSALRAVAWTKSHAGRRRDAPSPHFSVWEDFSMAIPDHMSRKFQTLRPVHAEAIRPGRRHRCVSGIEPSPPLCAHGVSERCESGASSPRFASLSLRSLKCATGAAPASRTAGPHHFHWRIDVGACPSIRARRQRKS